MTNEERSILRRAASLWGRLGGSVSSSAKAQAARMNGMKGGRPSNRCRSCVHFGKCTSILPASVYCPSFKGSRGRKAPR